MAQSEPNVFIDAKPLSYNELSLVRFATVHRDHGGINLLLWQREPPEQKHRPAKNRANGFCRLGSLSTGKTIFLSGLPAFAEAATRRQVRAL